MKTFTKIPNELSAQFAPNDVYTITVMYLTATYNSRESCFITDVTREQLALLSGQTFSYIKNEFLPRLRLSEFCKIESFRDENNYLRNRFYLPDTVVNFRIINSRVLQDTNLSPKEKGFMISLFTICENNSFNCGLDNYIIYDLLKKTSQTTFKRFKDSLVNKGYILEIDDDDLYEYFNYSKCLELNCDWIGSTSNDVNDLNTDNYRRASSYNYSINWLDMIYVAS